MMINSLHTYAATTGTNGASSSTATSSSASTDGLNPNDFMSLLVAEIQNQDPTQPMDPTTFMSQLVNLNQLEQVTQINQVVQQYATSSTTSGTTPTGN
ncbi:MAG TPA: flagellar hook capping FlgD N-terminal domain-containing protein [Terriglobia bacterium]|nr:flagellar hook capping FlgD N-terminal domain-containing protein [Terriglobia bacterium]